MQDHPEKRNDSELVSSQAKSESCHYAQLLKEKALLAVFPSFRLTTVMLLSVH